VINLRSAKGDREFEEERILPIPSFDHPMNRSPD